MFFIGLQGWETMTCVESVFLLSQWQGASAQGDGTSSAAREGQQGAANGDLMWILVECIYCVVWYIYIYICIVIYLSIFLSIYSAIFFLCEHMRLPTWYIYIYDSLQHYMNIFLQRSWGLGWTCLIIKWYPLLFMMVLIRKTMINYLIKGCPIFRQTHFSMIICECELVDFNTPREIWWRPEQGIRTARRLWGLQAYRFWRDLFNLFIIKSLIQFLNAHK